jgi:hypothetical protein
MAVLHTRQIAAQQAGALFNVALRHASLQTEITDGLADIHSFVKKLRDEET